MSEAFFARSRKCNKLDSLARRKDRYVCVDGHDISTAAAEDTLHSFSI